MARPRRGKRRRPQRDWLSEYMVTGIEPDRDDPDINPFEVLDFCYGDSEGLRAAWQRSGIMRKWDIPGRRPYCWWLYDAPRLPMGTFPGWYYDGKLPKPRRHLSGPGKPLHEALAFQPSQHFGLWDWFGDPANPPRFETQYDYLKRHGLLLPGEDEPLPENFTEPAQIMDAAAWEALRKL